MARNEEGEFELILGNRQLLSVFFIVVVLLGLCFLMGYVIGRNSAPVVNAENVPLPEESGDPLVIPPAESTPEIATAPEPPAETAPQAPVEPKPLPPPKPAPPEVKQEAKQEPKQETKQPPKQEAKLPPLPPAPGSTPSGAYLQLSATSRAEAEAYVDRLRSKGFAATLAPAPVGNLVRVLVGPFPDSPAEFQRIRERLNASQFPGSDGQPRRY